MRGVEGKAGKRRFGFAYILLIISIVTYLCASAYAAVASDWSARADIPQIDPILKIIKGLRQYQQVKATFPQTFTQVETQVWRHPRPPDYGADGHSVVLKNYYYFYTWISPTRCTLPTLLGASSTRGAPMALAILMGLLVTVQAYWWSGMIP